MAAIYTEGRTQRENFDAVDFFFFRIPVIIIYVAPFFQLAVVWGWFLAITVYSGLNYSYTTRCRQKKISRQPNQS